MSSSDASTNPFVGPRPFQRGETLHGRGREARDLFYLLAAERVVWLYSPSGAGKTSLVQAGLVPRLEADGFDVWPTIRVGWPSEGAGNRYLASAAASLEQGFADERGTPREPAADFGDLTFGEAVARLRERRGDASVVLLFDQLEEVVTADPLDVDAKHDFFRQVGKLLQDPELWALFILREDYLAPLDPYLDHIPTRITNTFRLDLLGLEATRKIAIETARDGGRAFADDAVARLIDDLATVSVQRPDGTVAQAAGLHVEPVQLQVVCRRLWQRLPAEAERIDLGHVEAAGDVDSALEAYYVQQVEAAAAATGAGERRVRDWFDHRLITEQGIRAQVLKGAEVSEGLDNRAIQRLVDGHLVRSERRRGAIWFELAHDRLVAPVRASNDAWRDVHLSVLQRQAELWERQGRPRGMLLAGDALDEAERWAASTDDAMIGAERDLLEESRRERRTASKIRLLAISASLLAIFALVALAVAMDSCFKFERQSLVFESTSLSRKMAVQSSQLLDTQLDLGMLLALEAKRVAPTFEARRSLLAAIAHEPRLQLFLNGLQSPATSVAASLDGKLFAAGARDGRIMLWDAESGKERAGSPLEIAGVFELAVAISGDGRWLAAGGPLVDNPSRGRLGLWDLTDWLPASTDGPPDPGGRVNDLAFCGVGEAATLAWTTKTHIRLWRRGSPPETVLERVPVRGLAWAPDCGCLAAGHERDGGVSLVGVGDRGCTPRTLVGPRGRVTSLAFDPAGKKLAIARQAAIAIFDMSNDAWVEMIDGPWTGVAFSPDGASLAAADDAGAVALWDVADGRPAGAPLVGHDGAVAAVAFDATGDRLISGGSDGRVIVWRPNASSRLGRALRGHDDEVWAVVFAPNGAQLASAGKDRTVRLWDLDSGQHTILPGTTGHVRALAFDAEGTRLAAGSREDGRLHLWRLPLRETSVDGVHWSALGSRPVDAVAFSPDGATLASAVDRNILIWDLSRNPPESRVLASHDGDVWSLLFRDQGATLAASDARGKVVLWRVADGKEIGRLIGDPPAEASLREGYELLAEIAQSRDETLLAAASREGGERCVYLWQARQPTLSGAPEEFQGCLHGHRSPVASVAFSAGRNLLISADLGGELIFWDVTERREIGRLRYGEEPVAINSLAVSPDGATLASASDGGSIILWDLNWQDAACRVAGRDLTESEWRAYVGGEPRSGVCGNPGGLPQDL